jgi:hemerythrin
MEKNIFARWSRRYYVGIPVIDSQHKRLIALINDLYHAEWDGSTEAKIRYAIALKQAVYCSRHGFSIEERIMDSMGYSGAEKHKHEHAEFIKTVLDSIRIFESGGRFIPGRFVLFFRDRILTHFAMTDTALGKYLLNLKRSETTEQKATRALAG